MKERTLANSRPNTQTCAHTHLCEVVDASKLEDGGHAVEEGADDEPVQRGGVVDLGQPGPAVQGDGGESQDGRDALRRPEMTGSVW